MFMFKIGDFSQIGQISVRMLRHYDKIGLLKPSHIDESSGYRYYTIEQLPRLNRIAALKDLGLTLQQITDLLSEDLPLERLQIMLEHKKQELQTQMQEDMARLTRITTRLHQIEHEDEPLPYEVALNSMPEHQLLAIREIVPNLVSMGDFRNRMLHQLYDWLAEHSVKYAEEAVLYNVSSYQETDLDMSIGVFLSSPLDVPLQHDAPVIIQTLPAQPLVGSIVHRCPIRQVKDLVVALYRWIGVNEYASAGQCCEIHRFGCELDVCREPFPEVVVEVLVPVERL